MPVLLFHLDEKWIPHGFYGVDVFFVISGYLITSIIAHQIANQSFSLVAFWERRVRRIFPVLAAMVILTTIVAFFVQFRPRLEGLGLEGASTMLSFANITMMLRAGDYWGGGAQELPFLHAWSLSVEEQFYLAFPILLWGLSKLGIRTLIPVISISLISLTLFLISVSKYPMPGFYLLPTRAWEIGVGCILALYLRISGGNGGATSRCLLALFGLLGIVGSYFWCSDVVGMSNLALLPVFGTLLVLFGTLGGGWICSALSLKPVVYIGKLSYSIYIWHWPAIVLSRQYCDRHQVEYDTVAVIGIIAGLSVVSYYFIERPARFAKRVMPTTLLLLAVGLILAGFCRFGNYSKSYPTPGLDLSLIHI